MLALLMTLAVATTSSIEDAPTPAKFFDSTLACYDAARASGDESLAVDGVYQLAKSSDAVMARDAIDVLGRLGTSSARAALAVVLCGSDDADLRARAADRLGDLSDRDALFVLALDADLETNPEVRAVVLDALDRAAAAVPDVPLSIARQLSRR